MSGNLFDSDTASSPAPLATRMRPRTLEEFVGQEHLLGPGLPTREAILKGQLGSVIFWAPPGCGKTTLALLIARYANAVAEVRSAVTAGVADVRDVAKRAKDRRNFEQRGTLLVLDEIHHFSKSQQDALLGFVEDGTFQLVGATTENPFFVLNNALLSRARVLKLESLSPTDLATLVRRALQDSERGLGARGLSVSDEALAFLTAVADGDARLALNVLETATTQIMDGGVVETAHLEQVLQRRVVRYDQQGDYHYDTISAFIKSMRGSNVDATLHYLARMLAAGEDPRFIARRMMILASEDVGLADPHALPLAVAASQAVERIGMPEGRIVLGHVATYLARAKKSNAAYRGLERAAADLKDRPIPPIPLHLRNAPVAALKDFGHGEGYIYTHDDPDAPQNFLPEGKWDTPYVRDASQKPEN